MLRQAEPQLKSLLYAQDLDRVDVSADGSLAAMIRLDYYPDLGDEDELDLAYLELLDLQTEQLGLRLVVSDLSLARALGADHLERLSTGAVSLVVASPAAVAEEVAANANRAREEEERQGGANGHGNGNGG